MGREIGHRGVWIAAAVLAVVVVLASMLSGRPTTSTLPGPSSGASAVAASRAPTTGPIVFYEILDADASVLIERRLDGASLPRRVAERRDADVGAIWAVDPAGTIGISGVSDDRTTHLQAVAIADGSPIWAVDVPAMGLDGSVWSSDGHRLAALAQPDETGPMVAIIIDTRDGRVTRIVLPDGAVLQGFDAGDALVLRQRQDRAAAKATWRFFRVDPASNVAQRLSGVPSVGPASDGAEDVDPAVGIAVTLGSGPNDQGTSVQAWSLAADGARSIATLRSVDRLAIDPTGAGVAVAANGVVRYIGWDGAATDL